MEMAIVGQAAAITRAYPRSRGFMLVSVLWIAGILAAFAIAVSVSVRSHALHVRNTMSEVLAAGIADGITRLAALHLIRAGGAALADGRWQSCRWMDEADAWVSLQDQSGLVDLNAASLPLLRAVLEGLSLTPSQSAEMAGALRDHRDVDHVAELGGTEPALYPGRSFGPKNAPFAVVEELDQIPGMTRELFERLRAVTTVSSRQPGIDFATAPDGLLTVLGLSRTSIGGLPFASPRASLDTAVTVAIRLDDGARIVRRTMLARTDQPERPFAVSSWDEEEWPFPELPGKVEVPCLDTRGAFAPGPT